jgi:hypothetical protein
MNPQLPTRRAMDVEKPLRTLPVTPLPVYPTPRLQHPLSEQPMGQFSVEVWDLVGRTERVLFLRDGGIARLWLAIL